MDTLLPRRRKLCILFASAAWLTITCAAPMKAGVLLPPVDVNSLVMLETQAQDMALLGLIIGPNQDPLAWNGSFNDSGWAWSANGTYNGAPLSLSYTGTYNPAGTVDPNSDVVSWTGAGTI